MVLKGDTLAPPVFPSGYLPNNEPAEPIIRMNWPKISFISNFRMPRRSIQ